MKERHGIDATTADRLLGGRVHPDDAPPGYAGAAELARRAASFAVPAEADVDAAAAAMAAVVVANPLPSADLRRKSVLSKMLTTKAAIAGFAVVLTATGAAASTDSLPEPAQNVVASALENVGINVGDDDDAKDKKDKADKEADEATTEVEESEGTGPSDKSLYGRCTAAAAHERNGAEPTSANFADGVMKADGTAADCEAVIAAKKATEESTATEDTASKGKKPETTGTSSKPDTAGKPDTTGKPEAAPFDDGAPEAGKAFGQSRAEERRSETAGSHETETESESETESD